MISELVVGSLVFVTDKRLNCPGVWTVIGISKGMCVLRNRYVHSFFIERSMDDIIEFVSSAQTAPLFTITDLLLYCDYKRFDYMDKLQQYINESCFDLYPIGCSMYDGIIVDKGNSISCLSEDDTKGFLDWFYNSFVSKDVLL